MTRPGLTLGGKYRLVRQIGVGAMGTVWAADELSSNRQVALKLLVKPTDELRQRLLREARACSRLAHPNIVRLLDVGETDEGEPFLALELLSGETLADMLKSKRRIEPQVATRIGRDIALALDAAHKAQIMHRDLKPANVMLHQEPGMKEGEFVVKVLDFGIAKSLGPAEDTQATMTGMVIGSPGYMSPEQVGQRSDLDHRTDIWSLGILLYELLAGVRPFSGSVEDVVRQVLIAPIAPISSRVRDVPPELEEIVMRCLERDRDKRISSAAEVAALLTPLVESSRLFRRPSPSSLNLPSPEGVAGTAVLQPNTPVGNPLPPWRQEMQESLSAHRNNTPLMPGVPSPAPAPEVTTTGTATMRDATTTSSTTMQRRRQGRTILFASIGLGVAAMLSLIVVVVVGLSSNEKTAGVTTTEANVASAAVVASAAPVPMPVAPPKEPVVVAPKAAASAAKDGAMVIQEEAIGATPKPSATITTLPPCAPGQKYRCIQGSKSLGAIAPNPFATSTSNAGTKKSGKIDPTGL